MLLSGILAKVNKPNIIYSYFAQALNYSVVDTGSAPYPSKKILGWEHFLEVHICVCIAVYVNSLKRDFNRKCNNWHAKAGSERLSRKCNPDMDGMLIDVFKC